MKIAVVTDDHKTISAHFGRALYYEVFSAEEGKITGRESLPKASHSQLAQEPHEEPGHAHGSGPEASSWHASMLEPIRDCQVVIARGMGQGMHDNLLQAGIRPVLTDLHEIEPAVSAYLSGQLADHPERLHSHH